MKTTEIEIPAESNVRLMGNLNVPDGASSLVIFSHGSGSSRFSSRNNYVARVLNTQHVATLLTDLLTESEDQEYESRFNIELLTKRLVEVTQYVRLLPELAQLPLGYFGASTGAASALRAAARLPDIVHAVVSRGGRPDLATSALPHVKAPVLLIVGTLDEQVIQLNEYAFSQLNCEKRMEPVEGATHLFEEEGKLGEVAVLAADWFHEHLHTVPKLT